MDQIDAMLDRDWEAANNRGQQTLAGPLAASADYDAPAGEIVIHLNNGDSLRIQTALLQGLGSASPVELADIHLSGRGTGLHFPRMDADFYIPALVDGIYGTPAWMRSLKQNPALQKALASAHQRKKSAAHRNAS